MTKRPVITTTLNRIRAHKPCADGWRKLLAGLGKSEPDDKPLAFAQIVRINGLEDALWATRAAPEHDRAWRLYAVWCARQVQHLIPDPRVSAAIDVAERFANGAATADELAAAIAAWYAVANAATAAATGANAASDDARAAQTAEFLRVVGGEP